MDAQPQRDGLQPAVGQTLNRGYRLELGPLIGVGASPREFPIQGCADEFTHIGRPQRIDVFGGRDGR